jgi:hypothetical protein
VSQLLQRILPWATAGFYGRTQNYDPASRLQLCLFGPVALFLHWYLNRYTSQADGTLPMPPIRMPVQPIPLDWILVLAIVALLTAVVGIAVVSAAERSILDSARRGPDEVGDKVLGPALIPPFLVLLLGTILTIRFRSLRSVWDIGFLWVAAGVQYIGLWLYLYYGPSLRSWASPDRQIELKQLEMVRDDQKMLLRAFVAVTFALLIGQVFTILKIRYGELLAGTPEGKQYEPLAIVNAIQLAYLILGWWALVFARCLKRIEEVRIRMRYITEQPGSIPKAASE